MKHPARVQVGEAEHSTIIAGAQCLPKVDPKLLKGFLCVLAVKVTAVRRYAEEETTIANATSRLCFLEAHHRPLGGS